MRIPTSLVFGSGVLFALALVGCIPNDDAGDPAFVSRVVPAVLGRKVQGAEELDVLTQVVQAYGRDVLVEVLMDQPEYTQYWTSVLADDLQVQYGYSANVYAQADGCFNTANTVLIGDSVAAHDLSTFLLAQLIPITSYSSSFTMLDAMRAGIMDDHLLGTYRAWLFPLASHTNLDEGAGARFFNSAFLGRERECLTCHSSTWSTTDDVMDWDRFAPFPLDIEGGLYKNFMPTPTSCGSDYGCGRFQAECSGCHGMDGNDDMGASDGDTKRLSQRVRVLPDGTLRSVIQNGTGNMGNPNVPAGDVAPIIDYVRRTFGTVDVTSKFFRPSSLSTTVGHQAFGMSTACSMRVDPMDTTGISTNMAWWPRFANTGYAGPTPLNLSRALLVGSFGGATTQFNGAPIDYANGSYGAALVDGAGNFTFAVAQHIVDNVLDEVWGERHTLGHGFERNTEASLDRNLRAMEFMNRQFSLRYLVKSAVLSEHFNRRAPASSFVSSTAYGLFMTLNPWAAVAPGQGTGAPEEDANGQGDAVHRYSPDNLYWSVHRGLGWNQPKLIPTTSDFPNYGLRENIGDFTAYYQQGTSKWSLGGLLYWEQAVGVCPASNKTSGWDWIAHLLDAAYLYPATYTIEDVVKATRDRLLGTPELVPGEEAELLTMLTALGFPSYPNLAVPIGSHPQASMDAAVRTYCGAVLTTPDYLLGGLPGVDHLPGEWPVLEVCMPGEPCGATAQCDHWSEALADRGYTWSTCNDVEPPFIINGPIDWAELTVEDALADKHDYGTATEFDREIAANQDIERRRLESEDASAPERASEAAAADAARRRLGAEYGCEDGCSEVVERWELLLLDEAAAAIAAEELVEAAASVEPAPRWETEPWVPFGDVIVARERALYADVIESGVDAGGYAEYPPNEFGEMGPGIDD